MGLMNTDAKPVMSTMWGAENDHVWSELVDVVRSDRPGSLRDLRTLWLASKGREAIILRGSVTLGDKYRDLVFAALLRLRREPAQILITDATWETGSHSLERRLPAALRPLVPVLIKRFMALVDSPRVRYAVLSTDELETFPRTWNVSPDRVVFTPFNHTVDDTRLGDVGVLDVTDGGYIFSGGDSLREYDLLEAALTGLDVPVKLASWWQPSTPTPNIESGRRTHPEFQQLLAGSHAVVIPLQVSNRSSGQQTYLNAMLLGKPVIVTEAPGVHDYIENGVTGVIVPANAQALRSAIQHVMDPANAEHYRQMGQRASEAVREANHGLTYRKILLRAAGISDEQIGAAESRALSTT